jgi:phosphoribosylformylglycinamidine synthase
LGIKHSPAPYFELDEEYVLQQKLKEGISRKMVRSAHDLSEGGLFVALSESGFNRELGFSIITNNAFRKDAWLFGEAQSRVLVSVALDKVTEFEQFLGDFPFEKIGVVTTGEIVVDGDFWGTIDWWKEKYDDSLENYLSKEEAGSALSSI